MTKRSMLLVFALPLALTVSGCQAEGDLVSENDPPSSAHVWQLQKIDDRPFRASATLSFGENGRIQGNGPCNGFGGTLRAPWPAFKLGRILSTKRACAQLQAEQAYFDALSAMQTAERNGDTLILRGPAGREMVFTVKRDG